ncbi:MAG TPA: hypothetical protein VM510_16130 [Caulifigura sp.]|jgi:hypothetical protein|nr:hypothetical protein [Caulifigura sp.]
MSLRPVIRRRLSIAAAAIGVIAWHIWPRSRVLPAELVGVWVASPNELDTFPIEFREDGRAREIDIWCEGKLTQMYDWSVEGDRVRLESPLPTLRITSMSQLSLTANYYWHWLKNGEKPAVHRRILDCSADTMRFEPLAGETQNFRRLTKAEVDARSWLN